MKTPGSNFLHEQNKNLHSSRNVETVADYLRDGGEKIPNNPEDKISSYLGFLASEDYVNDGIITGDKQSIDRQVASKIIIEPSEIPDGYFDLQRRIAREQGHGDIVITDRLRRAEARVISANQEHSLKVWAEYLSSDDAGYPDWFKIYAFESVSKLGKFDKEKGEFQKRSSGTTVPFPELSRGALSQLHSWLYESRIGVEAEDGTISKNVVGIHGDTKSGEYDRRKEEQFQKALKLGRFDQLYVQALEAVNEGSITPEQKREIEGSWKTYAQNSDPERLHSDLQGFGLDWCTANGLETATVQLRGGDFYVFYTTDDDGRDIVPRIAIRMQNDEVAEVRGIEPGQELESELVDTAMEKVGTLPGGELYLKKAEDMKRMTRIVEKQKAGKMLSENDLRFIYEIDSKIEGFGYDRDPRIDETINGRDFIDDIKRIFNSEDSPRLIKSLIEYDKDDLIIQNASKFDGMSIDQVVFEVIKQGGIASVAYNLSTLPKISLGNAVLLVRNDLGDALINKFSDFSRRERLVLAKEMIKQGIDLSSKLALFDQEDRLAILRSTIIEGRSWSVVKNWEIITTQVEILDKIDLAALILRHGNQSKLYAANRESLARFHESLHNLGINNKNAKAILTRLYEQEKAKSSDDEFAGIKDTRIIDNLSFFEPESVARNIEKFSHLPVRIAYVLIRDGWGRSVAEHLDRFEVENYQQIADEIVRYHYATNYSRRYSPLLSRLIAIEPVAQHKDLFQNLDKKTLDEIDWYFENKGRV